MMIMKYGHLFLKALCQLSGRGKIKTQPRNTDIPKPSVCNPGASPGKCLRIVCGILQYVRV